MDKVLDYIRESKAELKRVTWPNKQQMSSATMVVITMTAIMSLFLWLVDGTLSWLLSALLRR